MVRARSDEARRKTMEAVIELLIERGTGGVTIEEVAARSGVAKTTIYRHWPERAGLILDTLRSQFELVPSPNTGSVRGDLREFFGLLNRGDLGGRLGEVLPCLIEGATRDPEIAELMDRLGEERERGVRTILERARARGEIDAELDIEHLVGVIIGPIVFQKVVRRRALTPEYVDTCIEVALAGLTALGARSAG